MRLHLSKTIENCYFIHSDMWNVKNFPFKGSVKVINCGLGESNSLNVAGGIARNSNDVFVYGVAGFIIHRLEQLKFSCKHFGAERGKIILVNAGKVGYESFGIGHRLDDDEEICNILGIKFFDPEDIDDFDNILKFIKKEKRGIYYIRLGKDYEK